MQFSLNPCTSFSPIPIEGAHEDGVGLVLEGGLDELLRRRQDSQFHDIETGITQSARQNLCSNHVSIPAHRPVTTVGLAMIALLLTIKS